jgi:hypothetical protein
MLSSFVSGDELWLVTEFHAPGSCEDLMRRAHQNGLREGPTLAILREVAQGLGYMHGCGLLHRHLRSRSILIDESGRVRLTSLGYVERLHDGRQRHRQSKALVDFMAWTAPEVLQQSSDYGTGVDVWSFGITAIELLCGVPPHIGMEPLQMMFTILHGEPPKPSCGSKAIRDLIDACLQRRPWQRARVEDLFARPCLEPVCEVASRKSILAAVASAELRDRHCDAQRAVLQVQHAYATAPSSRLLSSPSDRLHASVLQQTGFGGVHLTTVATKLPKLHDVAFIPSVRSRQVRDLGAGITAADVVQKRKAFERHEPSSSMVEGALGALWSFGSSSPLFATAGLGQEVPMASNEHRVPNAWLAAMGASRDDAASVFARMLVNRPLNESSEEPPNDSGYGPCDGPKARFVGFVEDDQSKTRESLGVRMGAWHAREARHASLFAPYGASNEDEQRPRIAGLKSPHTQLMYDRPLLPTELSICSLARISELLHCPSGRCRLLEQRVAMHATDGDTHIWQVDAQNTQAADNDSCWTSAPIHHMATLADNQLDDLRTSVHQVTSVAIQTSALPVSRAHELLRILDGCTALHQHLKEQNGLLDYDNRRLRTLLGMPHVRPMAVNPTDVL